MQEEDLTRKVEDYQKIASMTKDSRVQWEVKRVLWYGGVSKEISYTAETCLWHVMSHSASPIPIRYVLVKTSRDEFPVLLMTTDLGLEAQQIIETYVTRWNIEVTFHEAREHLGIETQRQWSDLAIKRTTPILFALYSLVVLIGNGLIKENLVEKERTAWYSKEGIKFSDLLRGVRKHLLEKVYFCKWLQSGGTDQKSNEDFANKAIDLFLHAA